MASVAAATWLVFLPLLIASGSPEVAALGNFGKKPEPRAQAKEAAPPAWNPSAPPAPGARTTLSPELEADRKKFSECVKDCHGPEKFDFKTASAEAKEAFKSKSTACINQCEEKVPSIKKIRDAKATSAPAMKNKLEQDVKNNWGQCFKDCRGDVKINHATATPEEKAAFDAKMKACREHCDSKVPDIKNFRKERVPETSPPPKGPKAGDIEIRKKWGSCVQACRGDRKIDYKRATEIEKDFWEGMMSACRDKCDLEVPDIKRIMPAAKQHAPTPIKKQKVPQPPELVEARKKYMDCVKGCSAENKALEAGNKEKQTELMHECRTKCDAQVPELKRLAEEFQVAQASEL